MVKINTERVTYDSIVRDLHEYLEDRRDELKESSDDSDILHEEVDGAIPVYTSDLMELAADKPELASAEPDIWAFDGSHTAVNAVAGNLYELLIQEAEEWYQENVTKEQ